MVFLTPPEQDPVKAIFTSREFVQVALCLLTIYEIVHSVTCRTPCIKTLFWALWSVYLYLAAIGEDDRYVCYEGLVL